MAKNYFDTKAFGERLKAERVKQGLLVKDLAALAGLTSTTIVLLENGKRVPTLSNFMKLLETLNIPADALLMDSLYADYSLVLQEINAKMADLPENHIAVLADLIDTYLQSTLINRTDGIDEEEF